MLDNPLIMRHTIDMGGVYDSRKKNFTIRRSKMGPNPKRGF